MENNPSMIQSQNQTRVAPARIPFRQSFAQPLAQNASIGQQNETGTPISTTNQWPASVVNMFSPRKQPISGNSAVASSVNSLMSGMSLRSDDHINNNNIPQGELAAINRVIKGKLIENRNKVQVLRSNPNSPLYSVKSFEELRLPDALLRGLYCMGFQAPSKIQETALPILLANPPQNLIAQSQSGTGKTAAFLLASLYRINSSQQFPQVLILAPTYELALQIGSVAQQMAKFIIPEVGFAFAVRGSDIKSRELFYKNEGIKQQVIIGTPGTVMDWALKFKVFDIKKIRVFVLDEADNMIDTQGHRDQSVRIQKALNASSCQFLFFSATFEENIKQFAEIIVPNPIIIGLKNEELTLDNINQYYVHCNDEFAKYTAVANIFGSISMGQAFIFVATRSSASLLYNKLRSDGHPVGFISGELTVEERNEVIQKFRDGKERVLIATNVVARGIDVDQVTVVINYDLPIDPETKTIDYETYLHRIGRTGRFGKFGMAINFIDSAKSLSLISKLESYFGKKIRLLNAMDLEEIEKLARD